MIKVIDSNQNLKKPMLARTLQRVTLPAIKTFRIIERIGTRILENIENLFEKPLPPPSNKELELIVELKNYFRSFMYVDQTDMPPSEAAWATNMNVLKDLVITSDPRNFLRWKVIQSTMFATHGHYLYEELNHLKSLPDWTSRWQKAIREVHSGHPSPYLFYQRSSGNLIHHAYHLSQFEDKSGIQAQDMTYVFEFGGGYGSMCRLFYNLGFKGSYIIFDLPPFSALQKYYLRSINLPVQDIYLLRPGNVGVICVSDFKDLQDVLLKKHPKSNSMFVATWSISEAPSYVRESIFQVMSAMNFFLIAYQHRFGEMDNIDFFADLERRLENVVAWRTWEIEHLPGNNYLVGRPQKSSTMLSRRGLRGKE